MQSVCVNLTYCVQWVPSRAYRHPWCFVPSKQQHSFGIITHSCLLMLYKRLTMYLIYTIIMLIIMTGLLPDCHKLEPVFKTRPLILPSTGEPLQAKSVPLVRPNNTEFNLKECSLIVQEGT